MAITPLPTPPQRSDPASFAQRGDTFLAALPDFAAEANALAEEANQAAVTATGQAVIATTKAGEAAGSAQAAEVSAQNSAAVSGAAKWVSGSEYAEGEVAWSPIDYLAYRRKVPGAGTTDPSDDAVNWAPIFPEPLPFSNMTALAQSQATALLF